MLVGGWVCVDMNDTSGDLKVTHVCNNTSCAVLED